MDTEMSLPWFRLYRELKDDPKIGGLSDAQFRCYIESLCWACEKGDGGKMGLTMLNSNWAFRRDVVELIKSLIALKLISTMPDGELYVPAWDKRQMKSDSSVERVRKYRGKQDETLHTPLQKRYSNGIEERRVEENRGETEENAIALEVVEAWNKSGLTKCMALNDTRKRHLNARLGDSFFVSSWREAIAKVSISEFCKGKNDRGWRADFDWFLQPNAIAKIMEGKYDNRTIPSQPSKPKIQY